MKGKLLFKDLGTGIYGSCFDFVMQYYGLSFKQSLHKIVVDFNIEHKFFLDDKINVTKQAFKPKIHKKSEIPNEIDNYIQVKIRDWKDHDLKYWNSYGITLKILKYFNVFPIEYIFLNDKVIKAEAYSYAYLEKKDGFYRYKIYQPFSNKMKWLSNFIEGTLSGWSQLPQKGKELIITSSYKDVMTLYSLGFNSVAPQTETYNFKNHIIQDLKNRFEIIYIFYDYDESGIKESNKNADNFGFIKLFTNNKNYKDPSDYYKKYGKEKTYKKIIK